MKAFLTALFFTSLVWADDSAKLTALLSKDGVVTIPAGDYHLDGSKPIPLKSNTTVMAHGARFILPESLPDQARVVLFAGENIAHFAWHGGEFVGQVFDPAKKENTWEPSANTKGIEITTTVAGGTHDLLFREVKSNGMAAAVIGVHGKYGKKSESDVEHYAERVAVESCTLLRSGKFMWDYGYLWQIITFPDRLKKLTRRVGPFLLRRAKGDPGIADDLPPVPAAAQSPSGASPSDERVAPAVVAMERQKRACGAGDPVPGAPESRSAEPSALASRKLPQLALAVGEPAATIMNSCDTPRPVTMAPPMRPRERQ